MKMLLKNVMGVFLLCLCSSYPAAAEESPYRLGVILPLSGSYASLGDNLKNGIDLAYSELTPELQKRITIVYEDDQLESKQAVSAYQKLVNTGGLDGVFVLGSGIGNAVAPLAEQQKRLMVSIGASDKSFVIGRSYVFIHWVSAEAEARVLLDEVDRRGYKRLALLSHEQEGALALEKAVKLEFERRGRGEAFQLEHRVLLETRDFKTFIAKARSKQIDGVVVALLPGGLAAFAKQARDFKLDADLFGFELFEDENEVKASDGALIGKWYVNADNADSAFVEAYREAYDEYPGWAAANAYDTMKLVAEGVRRYGSENFKIAEQLRTLKNYKGAVGTYSASGDNRFDLPATVKIVEKKGFRKLRQ